MTEWNYPKAEADFYLDELIKSITRVSKSGQLILGEEVRRFEKEFSDFLGPNVSPASVLGVANGTDALELALRSCGVSKDDFVALPSHTAYATASAILRIGAKPLFIDICSNNSTICAQSLSDALTLYKNKIKSVIAVHLYGESCEIESILALCQQWSVPLIEDCAQATGTLYKGRPVGSWGNFACFSFYPTKNLAAFGDGGALITNASAPIIDYSRRLRMYGWSKSREAIQWGTNSRLDELQAAFLNTKIKAFAQRISSRRNLANLYAGALSELVNNGYILLPGDGENWKHSYNLYVIKVLHGRRDSLLKFLATHSIPVAIHYPLPCHLHQHLQGEACLALPHTNRIIKSILSLPLHPYLEEKDIYRVCECIHAYFNKA